MVVNWTARERGVQRRIVTVLRDAGYEVAESVRYRYRSNPKWWGAVDIEASIDAKRCLIEVKIPVGEWYCALGQILFYRTLVLDAGADLATLRLAVALDLSHLPDDQRDGLPSNEFVRACGVHGVEVWRWNGTVLTTPSVGSQGYPPHVATNP